MKKIIFLLILLLFNSCNKQSTENSKTTAFKLAIKDNITTLDPAKAYDVVSSKVLYQSYEQLYEYHYLKRPFSLKPLLAEEMPIISNLGKRYTIKIKKGVHYHQDPSLKEGRKLKAEDFIHQIKRLAFKPTQSNGWWLFDGKIKGLNRFRQKVGNDFKKFFETPVEGLKSPNDHTLVIDLIEPYPQMIYALSMSFTSPIPKESILFYKNDLSKKIIGTGPFKIESFKPEGPIILRNFPQYNLSTYPNKGDRKSHAKNLLADAGKKLPFLSEIKYKVLKNPEKRWQSFMNKEISFLTLSRDHFKKSLNEFGDLKESLKKKDIKLQISPTLTFWWLSFNMKDPLLGKSKYLRLAISHAIDREHFIDLSTNNTGQKANSIYPPGIPGYDPSKTLSIAYNLKKAKSFLKKAGFPNGKGLPKIQYDTRGDGETSLKQANYFKGQLKKIGVEIEIIRNSFPAFLKKLRKGSLKLWMGGWSMDYPDAENILQLLSSKNHPPGPNATFYSNKTFDQFFGNLKKAFSPQEKKVLMKKMEENVLKDLPWFMLYYQRTYTLVHKNVLNYRYSDIIPNTFKYIRVKSSNR